MTAFEDLKSLWGKQNQSEIPKNGVKRILEKIGFVQKKQWIANIVLAITGIVLIAFFFYVSAYNFQPVMIGLLLMIGALALRIGLEVSSIRTLNKMNVSAKVEIFREEIIRYYKVRTKVHFIWTPIIILIYCIGFAMLLPAFKENLSSGFYNYIIISSIVLLLVLCLFIAMEVRKELRVLKDLNL